MWMASLINVTLVPPHFSSIIFQRKHCSEFMSCSAVLGRSAFSSRVGLIWTRFCTWCLSISPVAFIASNVKG